MLAALLPTSTNIKNVSEIEWQNTSVQSSSCPAPSHLFVAPDSLPLQAYDSPY